jgi:hypothetical protein
MRLPVLAVGLKLDRVQEEGWARDGAPSLGMTQAAAFLQPRRRVVHAAAATTTPVLHCDGGICSWDAAGKLFPGQPLGG